MNNHYVNYHKHSSFSNVSSPDSTVLPIDYINRAKELGHKTVCSTEHGVAYGYYEYYDLCKEHGLKFLYGVEAYFTEKLGNEDKINSHLCLVAMNENGMKTINKLISRANTENYYYKPRVLLDWLLELDNQQDIFVASACVGGVWKRDNYEEIILKLKNKFADNFKLEVQYHNTNLQKDINLKALYLSKKHDIGIIMGTDSHVIYPEQEKDRDALLYAKGMHYEDEDGWMLDYPSYEECVKRFKIQGVLTEDEIITAIENTNYLLNAEEICISKDIKVPSIYKDKTQKEKNDILMDIIKKELIIKFGSMASVPKEYREAVMLEFKVIIDTNMADYFILNYNIIKKGIEKGGHLTLTSRGSAPSWYINNLLGFTTIDRVSSPVTLYPERFATAERVNSGSLFDIDFNISDRAPFIEAQKEILGEKNSYWFSSFGKLKTKSAWKMYAKANNVPFEISNTITKYIDDYEKALKYADEDEKDNIRIDSYIPSEYMEIFSKSKKYNGIIDSVSVHPCAFLLLNDDITEEIGVFKSGNDVVVNLEGKYADKYMYMKNDLLAVVVVEIIHETFKRIGEKPLSSSELMEKIKNNSRVWDIYKNGYTMCLNQVEQDRTREKVMKYQPKNISELSAFVAGVRPAFQSMLGKFLNREDFSYGIEAFDNILRTEELPQSYLLYQEQLMSTLSYVGFPISETYTIIKAIAKKKQGVIDKIKDRFVSGFIEKSACDIDSAMMVWKIIEDSSSYSFNSSHSMSVALDSAYGAYLKAYYPLEFYATCLEIYTRKKNKDKISKIKVEMMRMGIIEGILKYGENNSEISIDKNKNMITPVISSIKGINSTVGENLYLTSKNFKFNSFLELLHHIKENKLMDSSQLNTLILLDYFSQFGNAKYLLDIVTIYENINGRKQIARKDLEKYNLSEDIMSRNSAKITDKLYKEFDPLKIMNELIGNLDSSDDISLKQRISAQKEYLGYIDYKNDNIPKHFFFVDEMKVYQSKTKPYLKLYNINNGEIYNLRVTSGFDRNPFDVGAIIKTVKVEKQPKKKKDESGKWVQGEGFNLVLKEWEVL